MFGHLVSPLFAAGEVLLGLSLTVFVGALIVTIAENARSRRLEPQRAFRRPEPRKTRR
jgi:hypothetical protein